MNVSIREVDTYTMIVTIPKLVVTMTREQLDPDGAAGEGRAGLAAHMLSK